MNEIVQRLAAEVSDINEHLVRLYELGSHARVIVELGVREGRSTAALLLGAIRGGGRLYSYDLDPDCAGYFTETARRFGISDLSRWTFKTGDSAQSSASWADSTVDLLFIDTSHALDSTRNELAAWYPKMSRDHVICGHDSFHPEYGVRQAVEEFARGHSEYELQFYDYCNGLFVLQTGGSQVPHF